MNCRSDRFELGAAKPEEREQILEVFEDMDFKGKVSVMFTRRPDPCKSLNLDGEDALILVLRDKQKGLKVCAVGCCIIRKAFIDGSIVKTGYLTGLKILPEYRKKVFFISDIYQYLFEQTKDKVEIYYSTILKENLQAQKLLEKAHKGMPRYYYTGDYSVYCFKTGGTFRKERCRFEKGNTDGLKDFYMQHLKQFDLSPSDISLYGLNEEDFCTLRDEYGSIIAACALWNQQSYKQYIITGYSGIYKYLKWIPLRWLGYPDLPKENIPVNYASIALLLVKNNNTDLAQYFIKRVAQYSKAYDFLMLGLFDNHPLNSALSGIRHIKYQSRLYQVNWREPSAELGKKPINLEVGLL